MKKNTFIKGIVDGLPICFGYLSVAFASGDVFSRGNQGTESGHKDKCCL